MLKSTSTPVVVLGCFRHGGLGIVRSLGRLGVLVYAVHRDRWTPGYFSRYCREGIVWDIDAAAPNDSLQFLADLSGRIGHRPILTATSDTGVMFIANHAGQLAPWFIFPDQSRDLIRSLCDKQEMYYLLKKWNVPTPETAFPRSRTDIENYISIARFPVLLKPVRSGPSSHVEYKRLAHSERELLEHFNSIKGESQSSWMIQEYIPGGDDVTWMFNGYFDRDGHCKVAFTGRKLRNYEPYFGQTSLGICEHNEQIERMTIEFMMAVGYRGPLDLDYRYDVRDGSYKLHDINPRIGATFRLFVGANGMDVARALYQDMTGQEVLSATTVGGRKWIVEDRDWISALRYYRDGKLSLLGWRESLRGVHETSFIARDDPWPVVGVVANILRAVRDRLIRDRFRRRAKEQQRVVKTRRPHEDTGAKI